MTDDDLQLSGAEREVIRREFISRFGEAASVNEGFLVKRRATGPEQGPAEAHRGRPGHARPRPDHDRRRGLLAQGALHRQRPSGAQAAHRRPRWSSERPQSPVDTVQIRVQAAADTEKKAPSGTMCCPPSLEPQSALSSSILWAEPVHDLRKAPLGRI